MSLDPAGMMQSPDGDYMRVTQAEPILRGRDNPYYDRAPGRWVPSRFETIAPDGSAYVYPKGNAGINTHYDITLVSAATGVETTVLAGTPHWPIALTADTVYLNGTNWEWLDPGLWAADLKSGSEQEITKEGGWIKVSGGAAWGWLVASGDPQIGHIGQPQYRLDRLDLSTGQVTNWYRKDGSNIGLLGFNTDGKPIVAIGATTSVEFYVVTSPGTLARLFTYGGGFSSVEVDQYGLWMEDGRAVYLYNDASGLKKIWWVSSPQTGESNFLTSVAGHCT